MHIVVHEESRWSVLSNLLFILVKGNLVNAGIFYAKNVKCTKINFITGEGGKMYLG